MSQEGMTSTFNRSTFQRQASGHTLHDDDEKEEMEHDVQARIARANSFVVSSSDLGAWQHPTSSFRRNWNIFLFLGVCYNLAVIPIRIAFLNDIIDIPFYAIDYCFDVAFLFDVLFRTRFFAVFKFGKLLMTTEEILATYVKSNSLWIDLVFASRTILHSLP